jgi:hypothetical protein
VKRKTTLTTKTKLQAKKPLKTKTDLAKKAKKHTVSWYKAEAKKYFNKAVKYRDSAYIEGEWLFKCITCDRRIIFRDRDGKFNRNAHAGHFQPETYSNTRFNEENVNAQCGMPCNYNQGEQVKYARALDMKYGDGTAARLEKEAQIGKQWTIKELEEIITDAKEQIRFYDRATSSRTGR